MRSLLGLVLIVAAPARGAVGRVGDPRPFEGEKTSWHERFDRFDDLMDETTLEIRPFR